MTQDTRSQLTNSNGHVIGLDSQPTESHVPDYGNRVFRVNARWIQEMVNGGLENIEVELNKFRSMRIESISDSVYRGNMIRCCLEAKRQLDPDVMALREAIAPYRR